MWPRSTPRSPPTNSANPLSFLIEVDGDVPDTVELLVDGAPVATFTPQFFYRGFWDSASFAEGPHTLQARATLAGVVRRSGTVSVIIDRTPPRMTSFTPAATVEVDRTTTFTVDFSEPVVAAPFTLRPGRRGARRCPGAARRHAAAGRRRGARGCR